MPRNQKTTDPEARESKKNARPEIDDTLVKPVRHSAVSPQNDPEAEPTPVPKPLLRPYFKGLQILKAYHGQQLKYFVKMGDGITCFMFQTGGDEEAMFRHLMEEPKVASMVPLGIGEKRGVAIQHIQLNGLRMNIIKGRIVHIPTSVAEELSNSQAQTAEAVANAEGSNPFSGERNNTNLAYRDERELTALTR